MGDVSKYEGLATNRAPFFDGSDYVYWKTRMTAFLKSEAEEFRMQWRQVLTFQ